MRSISWIAVIAATSGCSTLDDEVQSEVMHAQIVVDPNAPAAAPTIALTVKIIAGPRANRSVTLQKVTLDREDGTTAAELAVAFPVATLSVSANEEQTIELANAGTTNADLIPSCGQTFYPMVFLAFPDTPGGWTRSGYGLQVIVACN